MIMNNDFIMHNKNVDYLRYQERKEYNNSSWERYREKQQRIKENDYSTAIFG